MTDRPTVISIRFALKFAGQNLGLTANIRHLLSSNKMIENAGSEIGSRIKSNIKQASRTFSPTWANEELLDAGFNLIDGSFIVTNDYDKVSLK